MKDGTLLSLSFGQASPDKSRAPTGRTDMGYIYTACALIGVRGPAALALGSDRSDRVHRPVKIVPGPVTSPVAAILAVDHALDILDTRRGYAVLYTNALDLALDESEMRSAVAPRAYYGNSEPEPGSAYALKPLLWQRCLDTGSRVKWVRRDEAPVLMTRVRNAALGAIAAYRKGTL